MDFSSNDRQRPEHFCPHHEVWQALATAIIRTACADYKLYLGTGRKAIEHFIMSDYFDCISDLDPMYLIDNLRKIPMNTGIVRRTK